MNRANECRLSKHLEKESSPLHHFKDSLWRLERCPIESESASIYF